MKMERETERERRMEIEMERISRVEEGKGEMGKGKLKREKGEAGISTHTL